MEVELVVHAQQPAIRAALEAVNQAQTLLKCLDDRERRILELMAGGCSNKAIAMQLQLSLRTVEKVRAAALTKLHTPSALAAVRLLTLATVFSPAT
jgi:two-component system, LuxR family, response regulator FixJ